MVVKQKFRKTGERVDAQGRRTVRLTSIVPVKPMKPSAKASVMTLVKNLINKKAETKMASYVVENNTSHNSAIGSADIMRIVPHIANGDDDQQRLGDSIKPLSLKVKGLLSMNRLGTNVDNRVLLVRVIIAQSKSYKSEQALATASALVANSLLKPNYEGAGTASIPFTGQQTDLVAPINTDGYRVYHDKVYRLACVSTDAAVEENPASYKRWSASIPLPASFDYDSNSVLAPTNFAPFVAIGYAYADGTGPDIVNTRIISTVVSQLKYKDF